MNLTFWPIVLESSNAQQRTGNEAVWPLPFLRG
jgi:hypothetical protein